MVRAVPWLLCAVALLVGCGEDERTAREHHPVVIVGFDGMEWRIAAPLIRDGRMPQLKALIERGSAGYLYTEKPALSPVCWTSIATGMRKAEHGIDNFLDPTGTPYTSVQRRTKALWNIASDYGLQTLCVGWWVTWPAEEIAGFMVAPYSTAGQNAFNWKGSVRKDLPDQTWPRALFQDVVPIVEAVRASGQLETVAASYFNVPVRAGLDDVEKKLLAQTLWSVEADEIYLRVVQNMQKRGDVKPDLTMTYFGCTDVVSHRFWRYMEPGAFKYSIPAEKVEEFKDAIANSYEQADRILGEVLAGAPANANVIVCSDHGFHAEFVTQPHPEGLSGHHLDGPPGIVAMAGPDVVAGFGTKAILEGKGRIEDAGYIYDVTPVVLTLLGVPIGRDMQSPDGGPLAKHMLRKELRESARGYSVRTHDEGFRRAQARAPEVDAKVLDDANRALAELGYLGVGASDEDERTRPPAKPATVDESKDATKPKDGEQTPPAGK
jgi:predicted AlkP superfamily phosphohydrolase/phosphomutase